MHIIALVSKTRLSTIPTITLGPSSGIHSVKARSESLCLSLMNRTSLELFYRQPPTTSEHETVKGKDVSSPYRIRTECRLLLLQQFVVLLEFQLLTLLLGRFAFYCLVQSYHLLLSQ